MHGAYTYFLTLAEELNFTRAAERLFITQQALSDHIRRVEDRYGVRLFERRPRLRLTPAGEAMVRRFRQLDTIETALASEIAELSEGARGHLRLGMSIPRARILAPGLMRDFCALFPRVTLSIRHDETSNFERMLRNGELDLFLGTNVQPDPEFDAIRLLDEPTVVLASQELLSRVFHDPAQIERWKEEGADLPLWVHKLPFLLNPPPSRLRRQADEFLEQYAIAIEPLLTLSDNETQLLIAAQGVGACFAPQMMAQHAMKTYAASHINPLLAFRIAEFNQTARLELVSSKNAYLPRYAHSLIGLMKRQMLEYKKMTL